MEEIKDILLIDSNDYALCRNLAKRLAEHKVEYEIRNLQVGDFVWQTKPQIIFERKTLGDFCGSMINNHLQTQVFEMQKITPYNYVIIVGNFKEFFFNPELKRRFTTYQFLGSMASLAVHGTRFLFVDNNSQMVYVMKKILEKFKKRDEAIVMQEDLVFKQKEVSLFEKVLSLVPNISTEKSAMIFEKYKDLKSLEEALNNNSFEVSGIGEKTTNNIKAFLKEIKGK